MSEPDLAKQVRQWLKKAVSICLVLGVLALAYRPGLAVQYWRGGLRPCDNLEKRLCADLGPTSCDVWKNGLDGAYAGSGQPRRNYGGRWENTDKAIDKAIDWLLGWDGARQDNPLCYEQLEDARYAEVLSTIRGAVQSRLGTP
jgi:hypothetical protein